MQPLDGVSLGHNLQRVGQVQGERLGAATSSYDLAGKFQELFLAARCKQDGSPRRAQAPGQRGPNSKRGTREKDNLSRDGLAQRLHATATAWRKQVREESMGTLVCGFVHRVRAHRSVSQPRTSTNAPTASSFHHCLRRGSLGGGQDRALRLGTASGATRTKPTPNPLTERRFQPKPCNLCGRNSVVECHLAKVNVEGSSPFARSKISQEKRSLGDTPPHGRLQFLAPSPVRSPVLGRETNPTTPATAALFSSSPTVE